MQTTVLIPSVIPIKSKLGDIPPVFFPLSKGFVLDYILESYENIEFKTHIILNKKDYQYENRLLNYQNIQIYNLKDVKDLGYSIFLGMQALDKSIIINFGDTILFEDMQNFIGKDYIFYSYEQTSDKWTFFQDTKGIINEIYDKSLKEKKIQTKKMFVGVFFISDSRLFKEILKKTFTILSNIDSFYLALQEYSKHKRFSFYETKNWYDIGHEEKFVNTYQKVTEREFNTITIDTQKGMIRKYSKNKSKFINEINWFLSLPKNLNFLTPRIFDYSLDVTNPFIEMEYYSYHTLHELLISNQINFSKWINIFSRLEYIIRNFRLYKVNDLRKITSSLKKMYIKKTIDRFQYLFNNANFKEISSKPLIINSKKYKDLRSILEIIIKEVNVNLINLNEFSIIHGDMCFSNILLDNNHSFIKLIDPRGSFGDYSIYGDVRYDYAKILHSIEGKYDLIIRDLFSVDFDSTNNTLKLEWTVKYELNLVDIFLETFKNINQKQLKEIRLIESLLFLTMIPLHSDNLKRQYAMLSVGVSLLDSVTDNKILFEGE